MKTIAFIPVRGGSKSIPGKNIKVIAGKPLLLWTVEAASGCAGIDEVIVCTDSAEIGAVVEAEELPKVRVVGRSAETATDTASTESAMLEYAEKNAFDRIFLVQATSPLLTPDDLDQALERMKREGADSLLSVVAQKRFIWSIAPDGEATAQNYHPLKRPRRQDFSPYYVENGAFYLCSREGLLEHKCRLFGRIAAHVMAEESFSELDEAVDWEIIERFLLERVKKQAGCEREDFTRRARKIKLFLTDVDGVLTDSGMYYSENGDELKKFNTRDGKGLELLRNAGILTGVITSENTKMVERRAKKLKLDHLIQGATDKIPAFRQILERTGLKAEEVAYIGDDLADQPLLKLAGLSACPVDAVAAAKEAAFFQCQMRGGGGCVREFAEMILAARI